MEPGTLTVSELASGIDAALTGWFAGEIWVEGEIESLRRSNKGHVYFQLVERRTDDQRATASVDVALFDAARRYVNAQLRAAGGVRMCDGMRVRIRGRVEFYSPQGRLQLRMSGIDPAHTLALLITERDRVLALLDADGVLERNRDQRVNPLPLSIGLVTSDGSAAMADFIHELEGAALAWHVCLYHVPVQGLGAEHAIAGGIESLARSGVDVVAIVRGGGSRLDLATFDSEVVARAIAASTVPVFTGIGHEIDTSVADVAAHTSSKTPTACAAAIVGRARASVDHLDRRWHDVLNRFDDRTTQTDDELHAEARSLARVVSVHMDMADHRLDAAADRATRASRASLLRASTRLDSMQERFVHHPDRLFERSERRLDLCEVAARSADPSRLMRRGWSITRTADGAVVRSAGTVRVGDRLLTSVLDGVLESDVRRVADDARNDKSPTDDG